MHQGTGKLTTVTTNRRGNKIRNNSVQEIPQGGERESREGERRKTTDLLSVFHSSCLTLALWMNTSGQESFICRHFSKHVFNLSMSGSPLYTVHFFSNALMTNYVDRKGKDHMMRLRTSHSGTPHK